MPAPSAGYLPDRPRPRWFDRLISSLFVAVIGAPLATMHWDSNVEIFENRAAQPKPEWPQTRQELRDYPVKLERYFDDNFGLRRELLALDHWTKVVLFHSSPVPVVLLGRSGWLYFLGEDAGALDRWYRGINPFSDAEIAGLRDELLHRREYLATLGIPYVVIVVPDKYSVYPEFLPAWTAPLFARNSLDRIVEAVAHHPELDFIDLRPALRAAKDKERLYYQTDSHWNYAGAMVGYQALALTLERALPGFHATAPARPPYVAGVDYYSGDLARMLGLTQRFREDDVAPLAKILADPSRRCAQRDSASETPGYEIYGYRCPNPPRYSALVLSDSMAIPLIPMLAENFSRSVFVSTRALDLPLVERYKPDIVIEEMVERSLNSLAAFPLRR
jgi:hypothetical protein